MGSIDGGVNYSSDNLNTHVALNKGIQAAHFWGFNTGWNEILIQEVSIMMVQVVGQLFLMERLIILGG